MNMLNPTMRIFASYTDEEQKLFNEYAGKGMVEYYSESDGYWKGKSEWCELHNYRVYRIKLKEGEWYKFVLGNITHKGCVSEIRETSFDVKIYSIGGLKSNEAIKNQPWRIQDYALSHNFDSFKPMTQEEIESVKPKPEFKRGDVVTDNDYDSYICRVKSIDGLVIHSLSRIYYGGDFDFEIRNAMATEDTLLATPDQIKQLVLEEMKAGKKWNGEGYDDWLTADGLTWNELIKHDTSEIECLCCGEWRGTRQTLRQLKAGLADGVNCIHFYRLKPKSEPTFIDVEIDWSGFEPTVKHPNDCIWTLNSLSFRVPVKGWFVNRYLFDDGFESLYPVRSMDNKCTAKATHARFAKLKVKQ